MVCAENIEKTSRTQQNNPGTNPEYRAEFYIEKHVNAGSMSFSCEEKTKVRPLCTKYETFSRNSNDMEVCDRIHHKRNLKKDAVPFRRTYGSMRL